MQRIAPKHAPKIQNVTPLALTRSKLRGQGVKDTLEEFQNLSSLAELRREVNRVKYQLGVQKVVWKRSSFTFQVYPISDLLSGDSSTAVHDNSYLRCVVEESQEESTTTTTEDTVTESVTTTTTVDTTNEPVTTTTNEHTTTEAVKTTKDEDTTNEAVTIPTTNAASVTDTNKATDKNTTETKESSTKPKPVKDEHRLAPTKVSTNNFCKFPFKVKDLIYWDCVPDEDGRGPVCNVEQEGSEIPNFKDTSTFQLCGKCSDPCGSRSNYSYTGFPLNNNTGSNKYAKVTSLEDCQRLCQQVEECNFFNFHTTKQECELMYGVGGKEEETGADVYFGQKNCPGKQLSWDS